MGYRNTYLRIRSGYHFSWENEAEQAAFQAESRRIFQELGWTLQVGRNGVCDTVTHGNQELYLHPMNFSGILDEDNIQPLREQLAKAQTFQCYHCDCYEEYVDMSDGEYWAVLESKRDEITAFILEQYKTKRSNLYVTSAVWTNAAKHFEICRLCDKDRNNGVGNRYMAELLEHLIQTGQLVTAETAHGQGIRTATSSPLRKPMESHQPQYFHCCSSKHFLDQGRYYFSGPSSAV